MVINKTIVILNEIDKNGILSEYEKRKKAIENTEKSNFYRKERKARKDMRSYAERMDEIDNFAF